MLMEEPARPTSYTIDTHLGAKAEVGSPSSLIKKDLVMFDYCALLFKGKFFLAHEALEIATNFIESLDYKSYKHS